MAQAKIFFAQPLRAILHGAVNCIKNTKEQTTPETKLVRKKERATPVTELDATTNKSKTTAQGQATPELHIVANFSNANFRTQECESQSQRERVREGSAANVNHAPVGLCRKFWLIGNITAKGMDSPL